MKKLLLSVGAFTWATAVFANGAGNGGVAWVCRYPNDAIRSAILVDRFEAQNDPYVKQEISVDDHASWDKQLETATAVAWMINPILGFDHEYFLKKVKASILSVDGIKTGAGNPEDYSKERVRMVDSSCRKEAAMRYENGKILKDDAIFSALPEIDKAMLYSHEAIYWAARENNNIQMSDDVKIVTASLYTKKSGDSMGQSPSFVRTAINKIFSQNPEFYVNRSGKEFHTSRMHILSIVDTKGVPYEPNVLSYQVFEASGETDRARYNSGDYFKKTLNWETYQILLVPFQGYALASYGAFKMSFTSYIASRGTEVVTDYSVLAKRNGVSKLKIKPRILQ